jgi:hypothetical protein
MCTQVWCAVGQSEEHNPLNFRDQDARPIPTGVGLCFGEMNGHTSCVD